MTKSERVTRLREDPSLAFDKARGGLVHDEQVQSDPQEPFSQRQAEPQRQLGLQAQSPALDVFERTSGASLILVSMG